MPCVCVGGGGGCSVASTTTEQYLAAFGYESSNYALPDALYQQIAGDNVPSGQSNVAAWEALCIACLKARAMLFCNEIPGDAGAATQEEVRSTLASANQTLGVASTGIKVGGQALNAVLPGVGTIVSNIGNAIIGIFANHAKAEAQQSSVLSNICPAFTVAMLQIDEAVATGVMSAAQGVASMQTLAQKFIEAAAPYAKACNAFCGYSAMANALAESSQWLYQLPEYQPPPASIVSSANSVANQALAALTGGSNGGSVLLIAFVFVAVMAVAGASKGRG